MVEQVWLPLLLHDGEELTEQDLSQLAAEFKKNLPAYAVPVFLRIQQIVETTGTFKYQKNKLKEQSFNPEKNL